MNISGKWTILIVLIIIWNYYDDGNDYHKSDDNVTFMSVMLMIVAIVMIG